MLTSSVTICCRIKRPPGPTNLNSRKQSANEESRTGNNLNRKRGSSTLNQRNSTLRSSAQSLNTRNLMSSSRSIRSSSVHSSASKNHNNSAISNRAGRSASLLNIYASNMRSLTQASVNSRQAIKTTSRKKSTRSSQDHPISAKQRKRAGICVDRASDCSSVHSSIDRLRTPASTTSRKNSLSATNRNNQASLSNKRRTEEDPALVTSSRVDKINLSIFGTLEDSPYVVCVPPVHTAQVGIQGKQIR